MSNKYLAILFFLFTAGGVRQILKMSTEPHYDLLDNKTEWLVGLSVVTAAFLFFAIRFWRKAQKEL